MSTPAAPNPAPASNPIQLAIIGAGFGSLALTIGLLRQPSPFQITIYESASRFAEIGAGVSFGPNAARAINSISKELSEAWRRCVTFSEGQGKEDTWFCYRWGRDDEEKERGVQVGDLVYDIKGKGADVKGVGRLPVFASVHRANFLGELAKLIPEGMARFGKCLVGMEELDDGNGNSNGVMLEFKDGEKVHADVVIGCDGIKSATRKYVIGKQGGDADEGLKFSGGYGYRSMIPREAAVETLGEELALNTQLYIGHSGYIISYPVESGEFVNMNAFIVREGMQWDSKDSWIKPTSEEDMLTDLDGWSSKMVGLVKKYGTRDKWALFDLMHPRKYTYGRVCLLGDSAHATTPHMGAGAGMAFEDAFVLSGLLGAVKEVGDVERVFRAYDAVRRERTQNVVKACRGQGLAVTLLLDGVGDDVEKLVRHTDGVYDWVWNFDLEGNLAEAKVISGIF